MSKNEENEKTDLVKALGTVKDILLGEELKSIRGSIASAEANLYKMVENVKSEASNTSNSLKKEIAEQKNETSAALNRLNKDTAGQKNEN